MIRRGPARWGAAARRDWIPIPLHWTGPGTRASHPGAAAASLQAAR